MRPRLTLACAAWCSLLVVIAAPRGARALAPGEVLIAGPGERGSAWVSVSTPSLGCGSQQCLSVWLDYRQLRGRLLDRDGRALGDKDHPLSLPNELRLLSGTFLHVMPTTEGYVVIVATLHGLYFTKVSVDATSGGLAFSSLEILWMSENPQPFLGRSSVNRGKTRNLLVFEALEREGTSTMFSMSLGAPGTFLPGEVTALGPIGKPAQVGDIVPLPVCPRGRGFDVFTQPTSWAPPGRSLVRRSLDEMGRPLSDPPKVIGANPAFSNQPVHPILAVPGNDDRCLLVWQTSRGKGDRALVRTAVLDGEGAITREFSYALDRPIDGALALHAMHRSTDEWLIVRAGEQRVMVLKAGASALELVAQQDTKASSYAGSIAVDGAPTGSAVVVWKVGDQDGIASASVPREGAATLEARALSSPRRPSPNLKIIALERGFAAAWHEFRGVQSSPTSFVFLDARGVPKGSPLVLPEGLRLLEAPLGTTAVRFAKFAAPDYKEPARVFRLNDEQRGIDPPDGITLPEGASYPFIAPGPTASRAFWGFQGATHWIDIGPRAELLERGSMRFFEQLPKAYPAYFWDGAGFASFGLDLESWKVQLIPSDGAAREPVQLAPTQSRTGWETFLLVPRQDGSVLVTWTVDAGGETEQLWMARIDRDGHSVDGAGTQIGRTMTREWNALGTDTGWLLVSMPDWKTMKIEHVPLSGATEPLTTFSDPSTAFASAKLARGKAGILLSYERWERELDGSTGVVRPLALPSVDSPDGSDSTTETESAGAGCSTGGRPRPGGLVGVLATALLLARRRYGALARVADSAVPNEGASDAPRLTPPARRRRRL